MQIPIASRKAGLLPKLGLPVPEKSGMAGKVLLLEEKTSGQVKPTITGLLISEDQSFYTIEDDLDGKIMVPKDRWRVVRAIREEVI